MLSNATAPAVIAQMQSFSRIGARIVIMASTLSTIEAIIPYVILAGVLVFIAFRVVVIPLIDLLLQARERKNEHRE